MSEDDVKGTGEQTPTPTEETPNPEVEKWKKIAEEKESGFRTLQRELSKTQGELQKAQNIQSRVDSKIDSLEQSVKFFAALASQGRPPEDLDETSAKEKGDLMKQWEQMQQQAEAQRIGREYQSKVEALGLTEEDDDYWAIRNHVESGRLKAADAKIRKLEKTKETTEETMPEENKTQEELFETWYQERKRKEMEQAQELVSDTGSPSTSSRSFQEIEEGYIKGEVSDEEYTQARRKQGL